MGQWRAAGVSSSLLGHVSASLPAGHALPYKSWNTASPTPSPPSAVYSTAFALGSHGVSTGLPPASTTKVLTALVTLERLLGEMVGDIDEEFIRSGEKVETLPDGSVRIPGMMRAHKAECLVPFLMNGATTVGGCVIKHMSCIPKDGDRLIIAGRVLVVEKMDHNRVSSILLLPPERKENEFAMESGVDA